MEHKNKLVIETLTAFVSVDSDGNEGVLCWPMADGVVHPLVCADQTRIDIMFPMAEMISKVNNMPYRILRFSTRTDITEQEKTKQFTK